MAEDWAGALKDCDTIEKFNGLALALARERRARNPNDGFAKAVAEEAKKRAYTYTGDRIEGFYVDLTKEEIAAVMAELDRRERRESRKRLFKKAKRTKIPMVTAAWEQWVYKSSTNAELGALLVVDYRKRKDNRYLYEFEMVPRDLYRRLFDKDAESVLENIYRMFGGQTENEVHNWKEAI